MKKPGRTRANANEMPQAASAHDTFWDFISLMPESIARVARQFIQAIAQHRNWTRQGKNRLVASPGGELRGEEAPV